MNGDMKWWPFRLMCTILYGSHPSITYPLPEYVDIINADLCSWLKIPNSRFREYLHTCQDMDMIEELRFTRGFTRFKVKIPVPLDKK